MAVISYVRVYIPQPDRPRIKIEADDIKCLNLAIELAKEMPDFLSFSGQSHTTRVIGLRQPVRLSLAVNLKSDVDIEGFAAQLSYMMQGTFRMHRIDCVVV
jgi:hypothetical protein